MAAGGLVWGWRRHGASLGPANTRPGLQTLWQQLPPQPGKPGDTILVHGLADPEVAPSWEVATASALVVWGQGARQGE